MITREWTEVLAEQSVVGNKWQALEDCKERRFACGPLRLTIHDRHSYRIEAQQQPYVPKQRYPGMEPMWTDTMNLAKGGWDNKFYR